MIRLPLTILLGSLAASAGELTWGGRATLEAQEDSNPTRSFSAPAGVNAALLDAGALVSSPLGWSPALFAAGALGGHYAGDRVSFSANYDVGARHYLTSLPTPMDTLTQQLSLDGTVALPGVLFLGFTGSARDRLGELPYTDGERPYANVEGLVSLGAIAGAHVTAQLGGGAQRFVLWDHNPAIFGYSFHCPVGRAQLTYRLDKHHLLSGVATYEPRTYNAPAETSGGAPLPGGVIRKDSVVALAVEYAYRGPVLLSAGYELTEQDSNSYGQSNTRHRLSASLGLRLPWTLTLLVKGVLQFARYPQGIALSGYGILLTEDAENTDSISAELVRPLIPSLDAELRYGYYGATLQGNGFSYARQLLSLGLTYRF